MGRMKGSELRVSPFIAEPGWYHGAREAFVPVIWDGGFCVFADCSNGRQLHSRLESILNVPQRVRRWYFLRLRPCLGNGASRRAKGGRVRMSDFLSSLMKRGVHT